MNIIERAFQLASSGEYQELRHLERQLRDEGYAAVPQHLNGPSLRKELNTLIRQASGGKRRQEAAE